MKIKSIKEDKNDFDVYIVTFTPNWIEKLFGVKETEKKYKNTQGEVYMLGGGHIYISQDGKELGNGNYIGIAIDIHRRKW